MEIEEEDGQWPEGSTPTVIGCWRQDARLLRPKVKDNQRSEPFWLALAPPNGERSVPVPPTSPVVASLSVGGWTGHPDSVLVIQHRQPRLWRSHLSLRPWVLPSSFGEVGGCAEDGGLGGPGGTQGLHPIGSSGCEAAAGSSNSDSVEWEWRDGCRRAGPTVSERVTAEINCAARAAAVAGGAAAATAYRAGGGLCGPASGAPAACGAVAAVLARAVLAMMHALAPLFSLAFDAGGGWTRLRHLTCTSKQVWHQLRVFQAILKAADPVQCEGGHHGEGVGGARGDVARAHEGLLGPGVDATALAVDVALGLAAGAALSRRAEDATEAVLSADRWLAGEVLGSHCGWLARNPGGLKLNGDLSALLAHVALAAVGTWEEGMAAHAAPAMVPAAVRLVAASGALGLSVQIALVADLLVACTLYAAALSGGAAALLRLQVRALGATWRLMRGTKLNPVAGRPDLVVEELRAERLTVGVLLCTPCALLLPTTAAFHLFLAGVQGGLLAARAALRLAAAVLHGRPWLLLAARCAAFPGLFASGVAMVPDGTVLKLSSNSAGPGRVFARGLGASGAWQAVGALTRQILNLALRADVRACLPMSQPW